MPRRKNVSKMRKNFNEKMANLLPHEKEKLESVEKLALELMDQYHLWYYNFKFGYGSTYRGKCTVDTIRIQYLFALNSPIEEIRNTILHEIAHAVAGVENGHNCYWQAVATDMGVTFKNYRQ